MPSQNSAVNKKVDVYCVKTEFVISLYMLSEHRHSKFLKKNPEKKRSFMWQVAMVYESIIDLKILGEVWKSGLSNTLILYNQPISRGPAQTSCL